MAGNNIKYTVTGRYMKGQTVVGYHLVGNDGSQRRENRERVIWMIGRGIIENMRTQIGPDNEIIIRGKNVNLSTLPVYDIDKQQFRNDSNSQRAASSPVSTAKSNVPGINQMGQFRIIKRMMFHNNCLGYEIEDCSGKVTRAKRSKVIEMAAQKLISNAVANKVTNPDTGEITLILRGVEENLSNLPCLIIDDNGNIIDPSKPTSMTVRAAYIKKNGVIKNEKTGEIKTFKGGDYIVCKGTGEFKILDRAKFEQHFVYEPEAGKALCDDYVDGAQFSIEVFGSGKANITLNMIKSWKIYKTVK